MIAICYKLIVVSDCIKYFEKKNLPCKLFQRLK